MFHLVNLRRTLAVVFLLCCMGPAGRADEIQYLPNNCFVFYSLDMAGLLKSKVFQVAKAKIKELDKEGERGLAEQFGIPAGNIARITAGAADAGDKKSVDFVAIVTSFKPLDAKDIKLNRKVYPHQKNFMYKEVKVGDFAIYQESYNFNFGDPKDIPPPPVEGRAFCVVEKDLVVFGDNVAAIKRILGRNKKPTMSKEMETRLKELGTKNMLAVVLDMKAMPERDRKDMLRDLGKQLPGLENVFDNLQALTLKGNAAGKVELSATMHCKDAETASDFRKVADAGIVLIKGLMKQGEGKIQAEEKEMFQGIRTSLDSIKLSTNGAQVSADLSVEPAAAVAVLQYLFMSSDAPHPKEKEPFDKR